MAHTIKDATLAMAGIFQATSLVNDIACRGIIDQDAFAVSINSLFATDPANTLAVYGDQQSLQLGLRTLIDQFSTPDKRNLEITKYVIAIMALERKLAKSAKMLDTISTGIEKARAQAEHFSTTHENVVASLADLYVHTISTLTPRIIVSGEHGHLSNPVNANKVRALLLAAIRSAVLWRQCGGTRWQLLLKRRQISEIASKLVV